MKTEVARSNFCFAEGGRTVIGTVAVTVTATVIVAVTALPEV